MSTPPPPPFLASSLQVKQLTICACQICFSTKAMLLTKISIVILE